jgi:hypothetical protein
VFDYRFNSSGKSPSGFYFSKKVNKKYISSQNSSTRATWIYSVSSNIPGVVCH